MHEVAAMFLLRFLTDRCCVVSVDEKEREAERNPEKELADTGFHDYQRGSVTCNDNCVNVSFCYVWLLVLVDEWT